MREHPLPEPDFWVLGADPVPHAAVPTLAFRMRVRDHSELEVYTVALTVQIHVDAAERSHDGETRERLRDVFGEPERWGDTARGLMWTTCELLVPSFSGSKTFELRVPCSSDLELATARYFEALPEGEVPLSFHFSGSIFYSDGERLQLTRVPWHAEAQFRLPLDTWRRAVGARGGLVRVGPETFESLLDYRLARGLPSLDAAVAELLAGARVEAP